MWTYGTASNNIPAQVKPIFHKVSILLEMSVKLLGIYHNLLHVAFFVYIILYFIFNKFGFLVVNVLGVNHQNQKSVSFP